MRRGIDFLWRSHLDQLAAPHDADTVTHHHSLFKAVGDVDEGFSGLPVNVLEFLLQRLRSL